MNTFTVAIIATFLVTVAEVSTNDVLAPIAILPDVDENSPALDRERLSDGPGADDGGETNSNENSRNSAVRVEEKMEHTVDGASVSGGPALHRNSLIETPNKVLEQETSSAGPSQAAKSTLQLGSDEDE